MVLADPWTNSMPCRAYTGRNGMVTCSGRINPTPTQMFEGIQL
jgi:hypothetical protein